MKKISILLLFIIVFLTGCATAPVARGSGQGNEWVAPMLSFTLGSNTANIYNGTINVARANSAEGVTPAVRTGQVTTPGITENLLLQNGAVKATAMLRYSGDDEFLVRFRFFIDEFSGHNIVRRVPNASGENSDRVLVLWKDHNGTWWDLRRSTLGGANTGGIANRHLLEDGSNTDAVALKIDRNTAPQFTSADFYVVVLDPAQAHPEVAGYVITYYAEMPDRYAAHFHGYEILVSTSTPLAVNPAR